MTEEELETAEEKTPLIQISFTVRLLTLHDI